MMNIKENELVEVEIENVSSGIMKYKGIVAVVREDSFILIPFGSKSKCVNGVNISFAEVKSLFPVAFSKDVEEQLEQVCNLYREGVMLEKEITLLTEVLVQKRKKLCKVRGDLLLQNKKLNEKQC
ncbi:hypothetical protein NDS46_31775 (plasmid) [Paenibacillus thiaminolyticus]|uniref:hypothetical protein n=1 Tax=Paenibacillus thiaminolyticus TaxID=49283 RepID=UPI00232C86DB|nr:hypothetical protein [Paenibacillus thiaminolyticus]WCF11538.1 hypothetical protein NDS46_31775 [Paenibacillus thiaminolyticus]